MLKRVAREFAPPILWRIVSRAKAKSRLGSHLHQLHVERNQHCAANEIILRPGLSLRIHPDSRQPFEAFCYRDPEMVSELDFFLENSKGCKTLLDIGALHGIFALAFTTTHPGRRAVAVDASPMAFARLLYNTKKNFLEDRVIPVECALSDSEGQLAMKYEWEHAVAGRALGGSADLIVEKTTADLLCSKLGFCPDVLKIDVEGHEVKVLHGLDKILRNARPLVFLEVHPVEIGIEGDQVDKITNLMHDLGYEGYDISGRKIERESSSSKPASLSNYRLLYRPKNQS